MMIVRIVALICAVLLIGSVVTAAIVTSYVIIYFSQAKNTEKTEK